MNETSLKIRFHECTDGQTLIVTAMSVAGEHVAEHAVASGRMATPAEIVHGLSAALEQCTSEIEGTPRLDVLVEGRSPEFFALDWRAVALTEGGSLVKIANRFRFKVTEEGSDETDEPTRLHLKGAPAPQAMEASGEAAATLEVSEPLRILQLIGADPDGEGAAPTRNLLAGLFQSLAYEKGLSDDILFDHRSADSLGSDEASRCHILHYTGMVKCPDHGLMLTLRSGEEIAASEVIETFRPRGLHCLVLDANGADTIERDHLFKELALLSERFRAVEIVALNPPSETGHSPIGEAFRSELLSGGSIGEAVSAARAVIRSEDGVELIHFSGHDVVFFDGAQQGSDIAMSRTLGDVRDKLFGFDMRRFPPLGRPIGDGRLAELSYAVLVGGSGAELGGEPGAGRTHLAHQTAFFLAAAGHVERAFFFGDPELTPDDAMEMIAPVLGMDAQQDEDAILTALTKKDCLVVFTQDACVTGPMGEWARMLCERGIKTIIVGTGILPSAPVIDVGLMSLEDRKTLAWQAMEKAGVEADVRDVVRLCEAVTLPGLIARSAPLLQDHSAPELVHLLDVNVPSTSPDKVEAFLSWQWSMLTAGERAILRYAAAIEGLLLEMLMIATKKGEGTHAWESLCRHLSLGMASFGDLITAWRKKGFLSPILIGHVVEAETAKFVMGPGRADGETEGDEAYLLLSELTIRGLTLLSSGLMSQPNPSLSWHVLMNRRQWANEMERLWLANRPAPVLEAKGPFERLLASAQLDEEMTAWLLSLIEKAPLPEPQAEEAEASAAWLALAGSLLGTCSQASKNPVIERAATVWQEWSERRLTEGREETGLFVTALSFLHLFARQRSDYRTALRFGEPLIGVYRHKEAWSRYVDVLKAQAACHAALGETKQAASCERLLLETVPYDRAPPGFESKQKLDVAASRLQRGDFAGAEEISVTLIADTEEPVLKQAVIALHADILMRQDRPREALPVLARAASALQAKGDMELSTGLRRSLQAIRDQIGEGEFEAVLSAEAPNLQREGLLIS